MIPRSHILDTASAAKKSGFHRRSIRRFIRSGLLKAKDIAPGAARGPIYEIRLPDLQKFCKAHRPKPRKLKNETVTKGNKRKSK